VVVELVARRDLRRQPDAGDLKALGALRLTRGVGRVGEFGRVAGVEVRKDAGNRSLLAFVAEGAVVPETILENRAADTAGVVPLLEQLAGCREARGLELVTVIAADHAAADAREIHRAFDGIAAALR